VHLRARPHYLLITYHVTVQPFVEHNDDDYDRPLLTPVWAPGELLPNTVSHRSPLNSAWSLWWDVHRSHLLHVFLALTTLTHEHTCSATAKAAHPHSGEPRSQCRHHCLRLCSRSSHTSTRPPAPAHPRAPTTAIACPPSALVWLASTLDRACEQKRTTHADIHPHCPRHALARSRAFPTPAHICLASLPSHSALTDTCPPSPCSTNTVSIYNSYYTESDAGVNTSDER
jgi:hypothetical protein